MSPYEATLKGLDAGTAGMLVEMDNGTLKVFSCGGKRLLLSMTKVKAGTWDKLWEVMAASGKVKERDPRTCVLGAKQR